MAFVTIQELAKHLRVGEDIIREWMKTGKVPFMRFGHVTLRFDVGDVESALKQHFSSVADGKAKEIDLRTFEKSTPQPKKVTKKK